MVAVFLNRGQELASLRGLFETPSAKLCRLYGRRRLGKTALLRQILEEQGGLFFTLPEQSPSGILRSLNDQLARETGRGYRYESLEAFLSDLPNHGRRLVVLDEFQRLRSGGTGIESTLQTIWDNHLQDTDLILVLCGSVIGMMRALDDAKAPLHGRFSWDLHLRPFTYRGVRLFYPGMDEAERVTRYAVFGATPHYHRLSHELDLETAIRRLFLDPGAPLKEEPRLLLELELRKPDRYQEILEALGAGCRTVGEIASRYQETATAYTPYVAKLRDELGLLRSDDPLYGKQRNQRVHLTDPFFHFYYRFIYPNLSRLELENVDGVMEDISEQLTAHAGRPGFEEVAKDLLQALNGQTYQGVTFDVRELGAWWDGEDELDAVGVGQDTAYAVEATFAGQPFDARDAETLHHRARMFQEACGRRQVVPIALARAGFTDTVTRQIASGELVGLTLEDLTAALGGQASHDR